MGQPAERGVSPALVLAAISCGGAVGSLARYGAGRAWPTGAADFGWTTLGINVLGAALLGVLMVIAVERRGAHPMLRPLVGTGLLGGFTTFSVYSADLQRDLADGRHVQAFAYGMSTAVGAVVAVAAAIALTRRFVTR